MRGTFLETDSQVTTAVVFLVNCSACGRLFVDSYDRMQQLMLPEVRQAVVPGRRGALPRHLQNVLLGVTDMTNELLTLRKQTVEKYDEISKLEEELGALRLELDIEQKVSDERADEIERLLEEREDTLAMKQEVKMCLNGF